MRGGAHAVEGAASTLELLVPGLLGPVPILPGDVPAAPILTRLLARGTPLPGGQAGLSQTLFATFGLDPREGGGEDLPSAPLCHLADDPQADQGGYWLHADPVHLRLDRDHLLLYDARHLGLTQVESEALVALFNAHFAADGLTLVAPRPQRWYLRLCEAPGLGTRPLDLVVGRSVAPFLPAGEDARRWMRLLNEAQMLFSQADSNRLREAEGRPTVSGIWLWGGGALSSLQTQPRPRVVFADHPLAVGLARYAGVDLHPLTRVERDLETVFFDGPVLVVWDLLWPGVLDADPVAWSEQLLRLEGWLGQVQGMVAAGRLRHWTLDGCGAGRWRIAHRDAWRLWRRALPLDRRLAGRSAAR
jgi:hypothetical protein